MSVRGSRIEKLYPALTARERGILVLQAWKRGTEEDPLVRRSMPPRPEVSANPQGARGSPASGSQTSSNYLMRPAASTQGQSPGGYR